MSMALSQINLDECAAKIREANDRFAKDFLQWIDVVGVELKRAQAEKSKPGSHESEFGEWVETEIGWKQNYVNKIIRAHDVMLLLGTVVPGRLPANEAQCRELVCVPEDKLPNVWRAVLDKVGNQPITAGLIRGETVEYRELCEERMPYTMPEGIGKLRTMIEKVQKRWPEEAVSVIPAVLRDIADDLEQEFKNREN